MSVVVQRELFVHGVKVLHFPSDEELTSVPLIFAAGGRNECLPMTVLYSVDGTAIAVDERLSGHSRALETVRQHVPGNLWYVNEAAHLETRQHTNR